MLCRCVRTVLVESVELVTRSACRPCPRPAAAGPRARGADSGHGSIPRGASPVREHVVHDARAARSAPGRSSRAACSSSAGDTAGPARSGRACRPGGRSAASPSAPVGVVALDRRRDGLGSPQRRAGRRRPARGRRRARGARDGRAPRACARRRGPGRIAGIGVDEHELADVVQQRGDQQRVAVLGVELGREPLGRALGGRRRGGGTARASRPTGRSARRSRRCACG